MGRLSYQDLYRRYEEYGSERLGSEFKRKTQTDRDSKDSEKSQSLSQKYESGQFFDSSDDENEDTESDDFYQPGKSKKKHRIKFNNVEGLLTSNHLTSGLRFDRKSTSIKTRKSTNSDNQINPGSSKLNERRPLAKISSYKSKPEVRPIEPEMEVDHPNNQIATIESKIGKLSKKMHTHIIITPPIGTEFVIP